MVEWVTGGRRVGVVQADPIDEYRELEQEQGQAHEPGEGKEAALLKKADDENVQRYQTHDDELAQTFDHHLALDEQTECHQRADIKDSRAIVGKGQCASDG